MPARNVPIRADVDGYVSGLIGQVAPDNQEAFSKLDAMFRPRVGHFLYKACGDHWLADELTNESFLRAYQSLASYRGYTQRQFQSFLLSIAANLLRDHFRHRRAVQVSLSLGTTSQPNDYAECNGNNGLETEERSSMLREALARLTADETILISLSHIADLPAEEIALIMGKPSAQAVRSALCRAMKHLRTVLKHQGYFTQVSA